MDAEECKHFNSATFQRVRILKARSEEDRYRGKDMGVSPGEWDGRVLTFLTKPLEPEEDAPPGWFRFGQSYFDAIK